MGDDDEEGATPASPGLPGSAIWFVAFIPPTHRPPNLSIPPPPSLPSLLERLMPLISVSPPPPKTKDDAKADVVKSRLTVQQVIGNVRGQATLTLDFVLLCFSAAVIAALGLARDDSVATIASMLISPLMGPILAITFGTFIGDRSLL